MSIFDLAVLLTLVELMAVPVVPAAFTSALSGAVASYLVNKFWAFKDPSPVRLLQVAFFVCVALGSAFAVASCVHVLSVRLGLPYLVAKAIGAACVFLCWSYPVQSRIVFPRRVSPCSRNLLPSCLGGRFHS